MCKGEGGPCNREGGPWNYYMCRRGDQGINTCVWGRVTKELIRVWGRVTKELIHVYGGG